MMMFVKLLLISSLTWVKEEYLHIWRRTRFLFHSSLCWSCSLLLL